MDAIFLIFKQFKNHEELKVHKEKNQYKNNILRVLRVLRSSLRLASKPSGIDK